MIDTVNVVYYRNGERFELELSPQEFRKLSITGGSFGVEVKITDDAVNVSGDYMHIMPVASNRIYVIGENPHE